MPYYAPTIRGASLLDEDWDTSGVPDSVLGKIGQGALGLLGTVGRGLDYPRRLIWRGITGLQEPTGRDMLRSLGIDIGPNKPGFDIGDVVSFGAEVAGDPLTWLGGFAGKTAAGIASKAAPRVKQALSTTEIALKGAEEAGDVARAARLRPIVERYAAEAAKIGEVPPLAPTWAEQGLAGQRQAFEFGIPGTRFKKSIPATGPIGQAFLGGLETIGKGISGSRPGKWLAEKFVAPTGLEATAGARAAAEELKRLAPITAAERMAGGEAEIAAIAGRLGKTPEEVASGLFPVVEKPAAPAVLKPLTPYQPTTIKDIAEARKWQQTHPEFEEMPGPTALPGAENAITPMPLATEFKPEKGAMRALAKGIRKQEDLQLAAEKAPSIGIEASGALSDPTLAHISRVRSAAGAKYMADLEEGKVTNPFATTKEHPTTFGFQKEREERWEGMIVPEVNKEIHKAGGPEKFFIENPVTASALRAMQGDKAIANAVLGRSIIKNFQNPNAVGPMVGEFRKASGLAEAAGENIGWKIPQDVANEFLKMRSVVTNPTTLGAIKGAAEGIRRFMSQSLLLLYPSYFSRNLTTNIGNTAIAGVFHPVEYVKDFAYAVKSILKDAPEARQWEAMGILHGGQTREFTGEAFQQKIKELTTTGEPTLRQKMKLPTTMPGVGRVFRAGQKINEVVEGASRYAHYRGALRSGLDHLGAVDSVKKYLFNFDELSKFEKEVLRPTVFFYGWARRQTEMLLRALPEKTGEFAVLSRATTQPSTERGPMPPWLRATTALPAGKDLEGNQLYWAGFGSPLDALSNLDVMTYSIPERIGSLMNPAYRVPMELLFGKDLRMQQSIGEMTKAGKGWPYSMLPHYKETTTPEGFTRRTADPRWLYALRNSPFSRLASEIGQVKDPTKDLLSRILNVTTGAKIVSVDEKEARRREAIQAIESKLGSMAIEGRAKLGRYYFPTGEGEERDPEVQALLKFERAVKKR